MTSNATTCICCYFTYVVVVNDQVCSRVQLTRLREYWLDLTSSSTIQHVQKSQGLLPEARVFACVPAKACAADEVLATTGKNFSLRSAMLSPEGHKLFMYVSVLLANTKKKISIDQILVTNLLSKQQCDLASLYLYNLISMIILLFIALITIHTDCATVGGSRRIT
ncbi:hypothetical protein FF38_05270 [Lucilia cuprina]|uniref:Uncharacterized protein n=1 Tax=Lucilia cuprina TaxID=7375 RepID=A0A0L0BXL0_LUCCU|nr:hypothetical protein FF38_05270 [Lucilia cuprina]